MKPLRVLLVIAAFGLAAYYFLGKSGTGDSSSSTGATSTAAPAPSPTLGIWEQPLPPGTKEIDKALAEFDVKVYRKEEGSQHRLEFQITEKHGYMADGISVEFWYRYKDTNTGQWIDHPTKVKFFVKERMDFKTPLVSSTAVWEADFRDVDPAELIASTSENWGARVGTCVRVMAPDNK